MNVAALALALALFLLIVGGGALALALLAARDRGYDAGYRAGADGLQRAKRRAYDAGRSDAAWELRDELHEAAARALLAPRDAPRVDEDAPSLIRPGVNWPKRAAG
ncbi:MAG: hypothetical protein QM346_08430 [Chloroflexota bacterium]|nr:hypothetical protein [Chloroflexota bacterium]